jgi:hypothetical protein
MIEFARVFFNIALLRQGPQHLPASRFLLAALLVITLVVQLLVAAAFDLGIVLVLERYVLAIALGLLLTGAVLSIAARQRRFVQVATAMVGAALVLAPIDVVLLAVVKPYGAFANHPGWLRVIEGAYEAWGIVIIGHIYRAAIERSLFLCVLLSFACEIMVVSAVQSLFPVPL